MACVSPASNTAAGDVRFLAGLGGRLVCEDERAGAMSVGIREKWRVGGARLGHRRVEGDVGELTLTSSRGVCVSYFLRAYMIQHPNASGRLRQVDKKRIAIERNFDRYYFVGKHQSRTFKFCHTEWLTDYPSLGWIEAYSPDIAETPSITDEIDCSSVWGPARFVVKVFAVSNWNLRTIGRIGYIQF